MICQLCLTDSRQLYIKCENCSQRKSSTQMKQESINTENKKYNMNEDEVTEERREEKSP